MLSKELEELLECALVDGVITDKERDILHKHALAEGVDLDEFDLIIDGRLAKMRRQQSTSNTQQSTNNMKFGNVMKCPSCGAQIVGGKAVCPECGVAFLNIEANSSIEKLQNKLDDFNRRQEQRQDNRGVVGQMGTMFLKEFGYDRTTRGKMDIISTFPVPNTRADLLEFLSMLQGRANPKGPKDGESGFGSKKTEDLSFAYWQLFTNCINKAKMSFKNDKDFEPYFASYEEQLQKTKGFFSSLFK